MNLKIAMVTIDSSDPRPLATWWSERLGAPIVEENDGWFFVIGSTPALAIQHVGDPTPGKNRIHLDLTVEDLDGARDELLAAGHAAVAKAVTIWDRCLALGDWPGLPHTIQTIGAPRWAQIDDDEDFRAWRLARKAGVQ